jgi:inosose dehydratase
MSTPKIAGAPISWGVCEVPGWGHQLSAERVLREMSIAGLTATELGPKGYLPTEPARLTSLLSSHGLKCAGTFAPVVLHDAARDPVEDIVGRLDVLNACGAEVLVLAAATGTGGYDSRPTLDDAHWNAIFTNLDRLADAAARRGLLVVLHPHVGTMVETPDDLERVLTGSAVRLCLDTGHLLIGGTDPVELVRAVPERIAHVHLKDVDQALAARVTAGDLTYMQAVAQRMYTPLGQGDVDIAAIVTALRENGFDGWFVLEQDTILDAEPVEGGPLDDVIASLNHLQTVLAGIPA